jgi:hypothetical protein
VSHYSDGDSLCDVCNAVFPPGWEDRGRFHQVWVHADYHVCERCLQALILACDLQLVRRESRQALAEHAGITAMISNVEQLLRGMAS